MLDISVLKQTGTNKVIISAPRRASRPDDSGRRITQCPFCPGDESNDEVYRVGSNESWQVRVIKNKFPFVGTHEVIIHAPDHHKSIVELPRDHLVKVLETYRQRYRIHEQKGSVYIFNNTGFSAGESLTHPHTQLAVVDKDIPVQTPSFEQVPKEHVQTKFFSIFCPRDSEWPDEVWVAPVWHSNTFGQSSDHELVDLASILQQLIKIFSIRHGHEFPFNFYIYPKDNWYLRLIPRQKTLGGFELSTNIMINTQLPIETYHFLKEHFHNADDNRIISHYTATYRKSV